MHALVDRVLPHLLHLLLGSGNDLHSKFKEHDCSRIERKSQEEEEAQITLFVEKLNFDEGLIKMDDLKNEAQSKTQKIITLIARTNDRGMMKEEKNRLNENFKKPLVLLIKLKTKERNEAGEALKAETFKDFHSSMHHVLHLPFHICSLGISQIIDHV